MLFELCKGSSQNLIDMKNADNWQQARAFFKKEGYKGKYLLIQTTDKTFKVYNINLK